VVSLATARALDPRHPFSYVVWANVEIDEQLVRSGFRPARRFFSLRRAALGDVVYDRDGERAGISPSRIFGFASATLSDQDHAMKPYLITTGSRFGLLAAAHLLRTHAEWRPPGHRSVVLPSKVPASATSRRGDRVLAWRLLRRSRAEEVS
jgi:hypothetical protein